MDAAAALGLTTNTVVAMGMADIPASAIGSGAVNTNDAHVYLGTSAWIGVTINTPKMVPKAGIASVPAADSKNCLLIGETETAGACRDWLVKTLGISHDEIDQLATKAEAGAKSLIFSPWMQGERSPVPDEHVRGGFLNLGLQHGRPELARAVLEGVALNLRWILDEITTTGQMCPTLRAIGGGAQSDVWLQILADISERPVQRVQHPRLAGAIGSALMAAVATGAVRDVASIGPLIQTERCFLPNEANSAIYRCSLDAFRSTHQPLSQLGQRLCPA